MFNYIWTLIFSIIVWQAQNLNSLETTISYYINGFYRVAARHVKKHCILKIKSPEVGNFKKFEINSCKSMLFTNHIVKMNNNNNNLHSKNTDASNVGLCLVNLLRLT